jgi:hypothetical protein
MMHVLSRWTKSKSSVILSLTFFLVIFFVNVIDINYYSTTLYDT